MSGQHELPEQGGDRLDNVVDEVRAGQTVFLTRGGQPVAAVVPVAAAEAAAERHARAQAVVTDLVTWTGRAPGMEDYRRVYASIGETWPGDDQVRQLYPVA